MECVFCKISKGEIQTTKVYEDQSAIAVLEIYPASIGHLIIFPKEHYDDIYTINPQTYLNLYSVAKFLISILSETLKPNGYNIITNIGTVKNVQTTHMNIHVIPVSGDEEIAVTWKPKKIEKDEYLKFIQKLQETMKRKVEEGKKHIEEHKDEIVKVVKNEVPEEKVAKIFRSKP